MIICEIYRCDTCRCEFYYPIKANSSATADSTVWCPKCGSSNVQRGGAASQAG